MTEKEKMYCETVKIVPDFTRDDMVSPLLFGNNLEHTRSCVNKGISAQMLRNRNLSESRHATTEHRKNGS